MFKRSFLPTNAMILALLLVMTLSCTVGALIFGKLNQLSPAAQERQRLEAEEWKERAEAERDAIIFWAWAWRVALALALVGLVLVVVLYGVRRSLTIDADERGIFPLLLGRASGAWIIFDANRSPTAATTIGDGDPRIVHTLPAGMENAQAQITGQAQAVQAIAAASSGKGGPPREMVSGLLGATQQLTKPLPEVQRSPWESSHVERLLIEAGALEENDV